MPDQRDKLSEGMKPKLILKRLDDIVGHSLALCDGGINDSFWMKRLSEAAGRSPNFALGDIDALMISMPRPMQQRAENWLAITPVVHRAAPDALRHMGMIAAALDIAPVDPIEIHI